MNEMEKFDVLEMKIVSNCKKKKKKNEFFFLIWVNYINSSRGNVEKT